MKHVGSPLTERENDEGHSMDAILQEMETVPKKSLNCSGTGEISWYTLQVEERHHYVMDKSLCSLVCATVQGDTRGELKLILKKVLASQCHQRSVAVQIVWSYSCNCHPFGSVLIWVGALRSLV